MVLYCQKCGRLIGRMELAKLDGKNYCLRCFKKLGGKDEDEGVETKLLSKVALFGPTGIIVIVAIGTAIVGGVFVCLIMWLMNHVFA